MLLSATGRDKKISIHNINIKEDYLTIWLWFNRDLNSNLIILHEWSEREEREEVEIS